MHNDEQGHHHHGHHHHGTIKNIKAAFFLNLGFTVVEIIGGFLTNSTAILADAVHDLGDSFALGQAWYFERLSRRQGSKAYTYGFRRFSLLGALMSTILLLTSSLYVLSEAIPRLINPEHSHAEGMMFLALIGIAVNGYAMFKLVGEKGVNARTIGLHLLEDVLGWAAVLVVAIILYFKDIHILDPILAILITLYIMMHIVKNIKATLPIFLQAAPEDVDIDLIKRKISEIEHINSAHHVHVWSLDGENTIFSAHLVADKNLTPGQYAELKQNVKSLIHHYGLYHSTVEIELPEEACRMTGNAVCN
ncbi:MAG: cation diffusion facilitator family transporter [Deltaproteobacteria bacterium]|nr:cation diffusion facilitator family transporter [Deltaproteobacteria bacterium]